MQIGDTVEVTPAKEDSFQQFVGHIIGFKEDLIQVEDQDGDVFDVEPDKINPIEV